MSCYYLSPSPSFFLFVIAKTHFDVLTFADNTAVLYSLDECVSCPVVCDREAQSVLALLNFDFLRLT